MHCRECGKPVGEDQSFCKYCGATTVRADVPIGPPAGSQPRPPRVPRRTALIVAIVAGALILVGGGTVAAITLLRGEPSPPRGSVTGTTFTPPSTEPAAGGSASSTTARQPRDYMEALINLEQVLGTESEHVSQLTAQVTAAGDDPPQDLYDALGASLDQVEAAHVELVAFEVPQDYVEADSFILDAAVMLEDRCQLMLMGIEELWGSGDATAAGGYFLEAQATDGDFREAYDNYFQALPTV